MITCVFVSNGYRIDVLGIADQFIDRKIGFALCRSRYRNRINKNFRWGTSIIGAITYGFIEYLGVNGYAEAICRSRYVVQYLYFQFADNTFEDNILADIFAADGQCKSIPKGIEP